MKKILLGLMAFIAMNATAQKAGDLKRTPNDSIRLDDDGEEAVKVLKRFILGEIKDI